METLTLEDLNVLLANAPNPPLLPPVSPWIDLLTCPICLEPSPTAVVLHVGCYRIFCVKCVLNILKDNQHRGVCRQPTWDPGHQPTTDTITRKTLYIRTTPQCNYLRENLEYQCSDCKKTMLIPDALVHPNNCSQNPKFKPPDYIHPWGEAPLVRRETFSNPPVPRVGRDPPAGRDHLLIYHLNGNQIGSKFVRNSRCVGEVKDQVAKISKIPSRDIKVYKFNHEPLDDSEKVGDIARPSGATHLTFLSGFDDISKRTVSLIIQEAGPLPKATRPR